MRGRDTALFAGMGLLGTGIERYLRGQEADTAGVRYAEQQLAQAQADLKAPTPKMSSEEKADMVQAAVAPPSPLSTRMRRTTESPHRPGTLRRGLP